MPATTNPQVGIGWRHPHYRALIERRPAIDFLEVHSENFFGQGGAALAVLLRARQDYPVSLHGVGLSLGSAVGLDPWHLEQLAQLVHTVQPARVSDHASFARGLRQGTGFAGPNPNIHANDLLPLAFSHEALAALASNVQQVQDRLQRPVLVENLSAYLEWPVAPDGRFGTECEFLLELTRRTGCQLLVDVNNIYVNALNAQLQNSAPGRHQIPGPGPDPGPDPVQQCKTWLDAIPPEAVGELHLAGHLHVDAGPDGSSAIVIDDHGSRVCSAVWQLYAHALQRFEGPQGQLPPTLVEWDTALPALDVLLDEAALARQIAAARVPVPLHVPQGGVPGSQA